MDWIVGTDNIDPIIGLRLQVGVCDHVLTSSSFQGGHAEQCPMFAVKLAKAKAHFDVNQRLIEIDPLLDQFVAAVNVSTQLSLDDIEYLFDCYFIHACNRLAVPCEYAAQNGDVCDTYLLDVMCMMMRPSRFSSIHHLLYHIAATSSMERIWSNE